MEFLIPLVLVDLLIFAPMGAWLAKQKGRTATEGAIVGGILGVLGIIVIGLAPSVTGATRKCPQCAELVLPEAKVCRFCGTALEPMNAPAAVAGVSPTTKFLTVIVLIALAVLIYQISR